MSTRTVWVTLAIAATLGLAGCAAKPTVDAGPASPAAFEDHPNAPPGSGSSPSSAPTDPAILGHHEVQRREYDLGFVIVNDGRSALREPVPVRGSLHFPVNVDGSIPVILFLHGRHWSCTVANATPTYLVGPGVCPDTPATRNERSYNGYDYIAKPLASHGYLVISVDANTINDHDVLFRDAGIRARGQLVLHTLNETKRLTTGSGGWPQQGVRGDFERIGLMGHSRGGEGVVEAANLNKGLGSPLGIRAVFSIAPTNILGQVPAGYVFGTLLPYCDGDVVDLSGAAMFDAAVRSNTEFANFQVLALGANHNYYNTVWESDTILLRWGDDAWNHPNDEYCKAVWTGPVLQREGKLGTGRLSPPDQRRHGQILVESFFRMNIGREPGLAPFWQELQPVPASACPAQTVPCDHLLHFSYHGPADLRRSLLEGGDAPAGTVKVALTGFEHAASCKARECGPPTIGASTQLALRHRAAAHASLTFTQGPTDLSSFNAITLRVSTVAPDDLNPADETPDFRIELVGSDGPVVSVHAASAGDALFRPPGSSARKLSLNMLAAPLVGFEGVDLASVSEVRLVFDVKASGSVRVADLQLQRI